MTSLHIGHFIVSEQSRGETRSSATAEIARDTDDVDLTPFKVTQGHTLLRCACTSY